MPNHCIKSHRAQLLRRFSGEARLSSERWLNLFVLLKSTAFLFSLGKRPTWCLQGSYSTPWRSSRCPTNHNNISNNQCPCNHHRKLSSNRHLSSSILPPPALFRTVQQQGNHSKLSSNRLVVRCTRRMAECSRTAQAGSCHRKSLKSASPIRLLRRCQDYRKRTSHINQTRYTSSSNSLAWSVSKHLTHQTSTLPITMRNTSSCPHLPTNRQSMTCSISSS